MGRTGAQTQPTTTVDLWGFSLQIHIYKVKSSTAHRQHTNTKSHNWQRGRQTANAITGDGVHDRALCPTTTTSNQIDSHIECGMAVIVYYKDKADVHSALEAFPTFLAVGGALGSLSIISCTLLHVL